MRATPEIFKFQRDMTGERVLAYPKSGEPLFEATGSIAEQIYQALNLAPMGKRYADAAIDETGMLQIYARAPDQNW